MKKPLLLISFLFFTYAAFSQEVGVRWGDVVGNDVALDLMLRSGGGNRIHADLSFGNDFGLEVLWDVFYRPLGDSPLYMYLGIGPSMLFTDDFLIGLSAEAGLELRFNKLPLAIGADWRPTYFFGDNADFSTEGFGVNARFVFGSSRTSTD